MADYHRGLAYVDWTTCVPNLANKRIIVITQLVPTPISGSGMALKTVPLSSLNEYFAQCYAIAQ